MGTHDLYSPELPESSTIDLDESRVPHDPSSSYIKIDPLVNYAKKTFRRYEESGLRINTFRLCVSKDWLDISGLTTKWTLKALKLGATDFTFRPLSCYGTITAPLCELFGSESLVRLCLKHSTIFDQPKVLIKCRGLRSLTLSHVYISSNSLFHILSRCPLIENLSLSHIASNKINYGDDQNFKHGLEKLTSLVMCLVEYYLQKLLLDALSSSKFPNLKELTLKFSSDRSVLYGAARGNKKQVISSHSLEILNFGTDEDSYYNSKENARFEFDVPSILKFTFEGKFMPNLYFRPTNMVQWEESRVSFKFSRYDGLSNEWFLELSKFLAKLRMSKIHLCLHLDSLENYDYQEGEIQGLYALEVEDLTINSKRLPALRFKALLDGLFRICRPKMISQYVSSPAADDDDETLYDDSNNRENSRNNDLLLCKTLEQVIKVKNMKLPTHFMHGLTDLDEVIAQKLFDDVWKPQPMDSILDDSTSEQRRFRFLLKWKPSLNQYMAPPDDDDDVVDDDANNYFGGYGNYQYMAPPHDDGGNNYFGGYGNYQYMAAPDDDDDVVDDDANNYFGGYGEYHQYMAPPDDDDGGNNYFGGYGGD